MHRGTRVGESPYGCAAAPAAGMMLSLEMVLLGGLTATAAAAATSTGPPSPPPVPPEGTKPHIVFAMIDDWGWYDNGFHGNPVIKTPFLDEMVRTEALLLERHYVFKYCSPTRRSFLNGRYPPHSGQANGADVTVDTRMHTIAAKLKGAGYRTGMSGKWHAGHMIVKQQPHGVGFDVSTRVFFLLSAARLTVSALHGCAAWLRCRRR
jgi:hypothetical protein